jgi:hypothetical protein
MSRIEQAEDGLSRQQRGLLLWAFRYVETMEARRDDLALQCLEQGIPWKPVQRTPAARAATSRTLLRLEERGLIERVAPGGRTIAIKLSILGRLVALKIRESK